MQAYFDFILIYTKIIMIIKMLINQLIKFTNNSISKKKKKNLQQIMLICLIF